jgi:hypothetical protein
MQLLVRILVAAVVVFLAAILMMAICAILFLNLIIVNIPVLALFVLVTFPGSIAVHELGHFIAGRLARFRAVCIRVWPFTLYLQGAKLLFQIAARPLLPLGFVQAVPNGLRWFRIRWAAFIVGGPLASIIVGVALILPAAAWPDPTFYSPFHKLNPLLRELPFQICSGLTLAVLWNLMLGLLTLSPMSRPEGGYHSDGTILIDCLFGHPRYYRLHAQFRLTADLHSGVRPRDWNPDVARQLLVEADGSMVNITARLFAYYHARDMGQIDLAFKVLDEALSWSRKYPSVSLPPLALEGAYMAGIHLRDPERARQWLNCAGSVGAEMQTLLRAQAAVALVEGKCAEAIKFAEAGLAVAPFSSDPGGKLAEIDWLKELLADCRRLEAEIQKRA